jgi:hypothetical protein
MGARSPHQSDRGYEPMFITVVNPHYRLNTTGRFYLVTRKGELVLAGMILSLAARENAPQAGSPAEVHDGQANVEENRIAERTGREPAIQALWHKLERKPVNQNTRRALRAVSA